MNAPVKIEPLVVNGRDIHKLTEEEVFALEVLCELGRHGARVTARQWRRDTFAAYGTKGFWVDDLAERGLVKLVEYEVGFGDLKRREFGWRETELGRAVLAYNKGDPNARSSLTAKRPVRDTSGRHHRF